MAKCSRALPATAGTGAPICPGASGRVSFHGGSAHRVKWSYSTSTTNVGFSGCHSVERFVLQRLGPPGARPVNPGGLMSDSSLVVSSVRSADRIDDVKPT